MIPIYFNPLWIPVLWGLGICLVLKAKRRLKIVGLVLGLLGLGLTILWIYIFNHLGEVMN